MTIEDALISAGNEILDQIGKTSVQNYMRSGGGAPIPNMVTIRTGKLSNAVQGGVGGTRKNERLNPTTWLYVIGVDEKVPYQALMEKGGIRVITQQMRKFFWAKFFETSINDPAYHWSAESAKWWGLAHATSLRYPARPYLAPAVEKTPILDILRNHLIEFLSISIKEIITGTPGATPL